MAEIQHRIADFQNEDPRAAVLKTRPIPLVRSSASGMDGGSPSPAAGAAGGGSRAPAGATSPWICRSAAAALCCRPCNNGAGLYDGRALALWNLKSSPRPCWATKTIPTAAWSGGWARSVIDRAPLILTISLGGLAEAQAFPFQFPQLSQPFRQHGPMHARPPRPAAGWKG